ncbi:MAG: serine hydrolase, partial [Longimicrobiales bacterium]
GYGLGWSITADDGGYRRISHTGGMPGVSTGLYLYPEEDVVVAVLTNRSNGMVARIAQQLAGAVMPDYAETVRVRRAAADAEHNAADNGSSAFVPADALVGAWEGMIYTPEDSVTLHLLVKPDGDVHVRLGDALRTLLNDPASPDDDRLVGRFAGTIPEEDARRHTHSVLLDVRLDGDRLRGQATAQTTGWPYYFALSSFVELERTR